MTPAAAETSSFLDADLTEIRVAGAWKGRLHVERRFEAESP